MWNNIRTPLRASYEGATDALTRITKNNKQMKITSIIKPMLAAFVGIGMFPGCGMAQTNQGAAATQTPTPGKDGNKYVPYEQRTGNESIVYFTRNLGPEGLIKVYEQQRAHGREAAHGRTARPQHHPLGMGEGPDAERPARG